MSPYVWAVVFWFGVWIVSSLAAGLLWIGLAEIGYRRHRRKVSGATIDFTRKRVGA